MPKVSERRPAFYAPTGSAFGDVVSILHLPYTAWHLSYVAIGAALAPILDWTRLAGTLTAFAIGLGVGAHALDEVRGRPLKTGLGDGVLWVLGVGSMVAAMGLAAVGAVVISPWVPVWGAAGVALAVGYALEWPRLLHTNLGFGLSWGAFPVLVGYWVQAETLSPAALAAAAAATLLSLAQRALSTPARYVRRHTERAETAFDEGRSWDKPQLLRTWEVPLRLLAATSVALAVGLVLSRL